MSRQSMVYKFKYNEKKPIILIIEPWAEELNIEHGCLIAINIIFDKLGTLEMELNSTYLTIWLWHGCRAEIFLNGENRTPGDPEGADTLNDCMYMFKAKDFTAAFRRAVAIGQLNQNEYRNPSNKRVVWRFMEVLSLDVVIAADLDGAEIYFEPVHLDKDSMLPFGSRFAPKKSKPIQTI